MKYVASLPLCLAVAFFATTGMPAGPVPKSVPADAVTAGPAAMSEGEVKRVDKEAGKLTIKHGPLTNLDMPAMTMVFRVKVPAMLDQVKEGDRIKFVADCVNGALTVVELAPD